MACFLLAVAPWDISLVKDTGWAKKERNDQLGKARVSVDRRLGVCPVVGRAGRR
jgi:hypothetical protein